MTRLAQDPQKVQHILTAAMHQFAQNGFFDTKVANIALDAGVSKGLVFHYFGSKEDLYLAAFADTVKKLTNAADLSVWHQAPDFKTMIARALRYKIQMQIQYPDEFAFCLAAYAGEALPATLKAKLTASWQATMQTDIPMLMDPLIDKLKLRPGIKAQTVKAFAGMLSNYVYQRTQTALKGQKNIQVQDLEWAVQEALDLVDLGEYGFMAR